MLPKDLQNIVILYLTPLPKLPFADELLESVKYIMYCVDFSFWPKTSCIKKTNRGWGINVRRK